MVRLKHEHTLRFCLAAFYMDFGVGMFIVALPYMALSMKARPLDLGILGGVRALAYIIAAVLAAMLSDRCNRKALIALSTVGVIATISATAATTAIWQLYVISILWAASLALYWPALFAWLGDSHSADKLATAAGAVNVSWSVGAMVSGVTAGWLFQVARPLPFLLAGLPVALGCAAMLFAPRGEGRPRRAPSPERAPGTRRELVGAWLGGFSACSLLGLVLSVFPALGKKIGVDAGLFGLFMAGLGLGRTVIFLLGLKWGRRLHDWRLSVAMQLTTATVVATLFVASSHWWLAIVFLTIGINVGVNYYRGLYKSLEGEGSRGLKAGIHEAILVGGMLCGSFGGGVLAHVFGLRIPYAVIPLLALLLAFAQMALIISVRRARTNAAGTAA